MEAIHTPLILYVPGLLPKPEPEVHKDALRRCLLEGVRRNDPEVAAEIAVGDHSFDLVSWTYYFYSEHRDYSLDADAVNAVIAQQGPTREDRREAGSWVRNATRWIYRLGDMLPFLIPHLATEKMELHIRDLRSYTQNRNGIADHVREMLKMPLRAACESQRPVLLLTHSMGSVIAYDSLWEMTHVSKDHVRIDHWLTCGSPLGQNYLQKRIKGCRERGLARYPNNIRRWTNVSAVGELTAIDPVLRNDFAGMLELGLVESITDIEMYNSFRLEGQLNVHAEYGYLASRELGAVVRDWWVEQTSRT